MTTLMSSTSSLLSGLIWKPPRKSSHERLETSVERQTGNRDPTAFQPIPALKGTYFRAECSAARGERDDQKHDAGKSRRRYPRRIFQQLAGISHAGQERETFQSPKIGKRPHTKSRHREGQWGWSGHSGALQGRKNPQRQSQRAVQNSKTDASLLYKFTCRRWMENVDLRHPVAQTGATDPSAEVLVAAQVGR